MRDCRKVSLSAANSGPIGTHRDIRTYSFDDPVWCLDHRARELPIGQHTLPDYVCSPFSEPGANHDITCAYVSVQKPTPFVGLFMACSK